MGLFSNDEINGGEGNDTLNYSYSIGPFTINLIFGIARGYNELDKFENIENIIGSEGSDFIIGNDN